MKSVCFWSFSGPYFPAFGLNTERKPQGFYENYKTFYVSALITIWTHLDYGDIIYDEAHNASLNHKLDLFQYNYCLAMTVDIRGTSKKEALQRISFEVPSASVLVQKTMLHLQDL